MKERATKVIVFLVVMGTLPFANCCHCDEVELFPVHDSTIYQEDGNRSNGAGDFLFAGNNGKNLSRRAFIKFDLSQLPANASVQQATLTLHLSKSGGHPGVARLHRVMNSWGEGTSKAPGGEGGGGDAVAGDATWNHNNFPESDWSIPGGDFAQVASAQTEAMQGECIWQGEGIVKDIQGWLDGTQKNHGWAIVGDETIASTAMRFNSRSNAENRPVLKIRYTTTPKDSPIPETSNLSGGVPLFEGSSPQIQNHEGMFDNSIGITESLGLPQEVSNLSIDILNPCANNQAPGSVQVSPTCQSNCRFRRRHAFRSSGICSPAGSYIFPRRRMP